MVSPGGGRKGRFGGAGRDVDSQQATRLRILARAVCRKRENARSDVMAQRTKPGGDGEPAGFKAGLNSLCTVFARVPRYAAVAKQPVSKPRLFGSGDAVDSLTLVG
jgi:hypothetical protein